MLALDRGQAAAGLLAGFRRGTGVAVPVHTVLDAQAGTLSCVALKLRVNLTAVTAIPGAQHGVADALAVGCLPSKFVLVFRYVDCIIHALHFLCVLYAAVTAQLDRTAGRAEISIQPVQRVGTLAFPAHFKMQVCSIAVAGIAAVLRRTNHCGAGHVHPHGCRSGNAHRYGALLSHSHLDHEPSASWNKVGLILRARISVCG